MNWYFSFIEVLIFVFVGIMGRHLYYRSRFFLQILQQSGYKSKNYVKWLRDHWSTHVLLVEHAAMNLVILLGLWKLADWLTNTAIVIIIVTFGIFWFGSLYRWLPEKEKKPLVMTPRATRLAALAAVFIVIVPVYGSLVSFAMGTHYPDIFVIAFFWIIGDLLAPFLFLPALALLFPVEKSIQNGFIKEARSKIAAHPNLKIIGITGSYGKTSTKFIIQHILKERFSVCFTPGSYNTPMGICKVVNNDLQATHQILILEMGARHKGNIKELCGIARPDIAMVTNVGVAHLETFGSREVIARTKEEIFTNMNPEGLAFLNADDPMVLHMKTPVGAQRISYGLQSGDFRASEIHYDANGCTFIAHSPNGESEKIETRLLGAHNVQNILCAIAVGASLGMRLKTMAMAAKTLEPVAHRLELKKNGLYSVIDDAFNSNPTGARNAIETLGQFTGGKRIIITPGIVELGAIEEEENRKLGFAITRADLDRVFLVGAKRTRPIYEGLVQSGFDMQRVSVVQSLFEANDLVREIIAPGDVVLYENDLPDSYNEN